MSTDENSTPAPGFHALTLADLNTTVNHEPRIEDVRLAAALGMERPRNIRKLIERHREALERFGGICSTAEQNAFARGRGRPGRTFWLNKRQALFLCTKSETPRATEVTIQMVEVFDAFLASSVRVKAHRRALPKPDASTAAMSIRSGHALMKIGRETVLVDLSRFEPRSTERAVLFTINGGMRIDRAVCHNPNRAREGRRLGYGLTPMPTRPGRDYLELGWIIGTVIELKAAKGAGSRGKVAPRLPAMKPPRAFLPDLAGMEMAGAA